VPNGRGGREHNAMNNKKSISVCRYHLPLRVLLLPGGGEWRYYDIRKKVDPPGKASEAYGRSPV